MTEWQDRHGNTPISLMKGILQKNGPDTIITKSFLKKDPHTCRIISIRLDIMRRKYYNIRQTNNIHRNETEL